MPQSCYLRQRVSHFGNLTRAIALDPISAAAEGNAIALYISKSLSVRLVYTSLRGLKSVIASFSNFSPTRWVRCASGVRSVCGVGAAG